MFLKSLKKLSFDEF